MSSCDYRPLIRKVSLVWLTSEHSFTPFNSKAFYQLQLFGDGYNETQQAVLLYFREVLLYIYLVKKWIS